MKKIITLLSLLFISSSLFAQIQITSTDAASMLEVGKAWLEYNSDSLKTTMNLGNASNNSQTWTVPNIAFHDTSIYVNVSPLNTPYASLFPTATHSQYTYHNVVSGIIDTEYTYYRLTKDTLLGLGKVSHISGNGYDTTITELNNYVKAIFPVEYGRHFVISRDSINNGGGAYEIITNTISYDAFGTITFPNGTFNTIRIMSAKQVDEYSNNSLASSTTTHEFNWLTKANSDFYSNIDTSSRISGNVTLYGGATLDLIEDYTTSVNVNSSDIPKEYELFQNYPNPFNPTTMISFILPKETHVNLSIYNILGQRISNLINSEMKAGKYNKEFNASALSSGIYFYKITAGGFVESKKMILLK